MRRKSGANDRRTARRDELWPGSKNEVFDPDDPRVQGYARLPRNVPLVMSLIDSLDPRINAGSLYLALWCHDYGQGLVEVDDVRHILFEAGYAGVTSRGERTWRERIRLLAEHGFIRTKDRGLQEAGWILLRNPVKVVRELQAKGLVPVDWQQMHDLRTQQVGMKDVGISDEGGTNQ